MNALFVMTTESWVASAIGFCGVLVSIISLIKSCNSNETANTAKLDATKALKASAEAQRDLVNTQREVNEMKLKIFHREEEDRRKADLIAKISGKSLTLINQGQAMAKNIKFTIDLNDNGYTIGGNSPFEISELESGAHIEWTVHTKEGGIKEIPVLFTWDDDYGTGRTKKATIHIN